MADPASERLDSRFEAALATLRREVVGGRFADADMLPGERDLSDLLGVSRTTVRRVLTVLAGEGVVTQRQGVGTFVHRLAAAEPARPERPLAGFTEEMRLRGLRASSRDIERGVARPTPEEAMMLAVSPETVVARLSRIRFADARPMAVEIAAVPCFLMPDPDEVGASLYAALTRRGMRPVRALQRVQAVIVDDEDAPRLAVPLRSAVLLIRRVAYLADGRPCVFTRSACRSDHYDLVSELGDSLPVEGS